jgi:hypothetical protein
MYQANLPHILAKTSPLPSTLQDYSAALANAGNFLAEIEKAHANPLPGDPLVKSTFSQSGSPTSGLTYYDLETGAKFVYPLLTPLRNEIPRVSGMAACGPTGVQSPASTPPACASACPAVSLDDFSRTGPRPT